MIALFFLSVFCILGSFTCGCVAVDIAVKDPGTPGREFAAKQLAIGAWSLACVAVAALSVAAVVLVTEPTVESITVVEQPQVAE
jgi:hypothetical protein